MTLSTLMEWPIKDMRGLWNCLRGRHEHMSMGGPRPDLCLRCWKRFSETGVTKQ
jgi:hypothetical protein